jgi:lactate racemase
VQVSHIQGGPDIGDAGIRQAFAAPIGASRLRDLARGRRDAAILIDDLTRPTPSYRVLPYILEELAAAGLGDDKVRIVCAIASHRSMTRVDFVKKIGLDLVERLEVINHNAQDNLEFYGHSSQGIPIWVNRQFARADLKIAAGMVTPRGAFFGGGAKLLLPGAVGRETIFLNHTYCPDHLYRQHVDEVARMVGLNYIVNPLLNMEGGIMALVVGDIVQAYERGVEIGRELYRCPVPQGLDVAICNAWPKDTEATQAGMGRVPLLSPLGRTAVRQGGTVVIATASSEGLGFHSVMMPGTLFKERAMAHPDRLATRTRLRQIVFSPNLNQYDVRAQFGEEFLFYKAWPEVVADLAREYGDAPRVCVFPGGAMQFGGD